MLDVDIVDTLICLYEGRYDGFSSELLHFLENERQGLENCQQAAIVH